VLSRPKPWVTGLLVALVATALLHWRQAGRSAGLEGAIAEQDARLARLADLPERLRAFEAGRALRASLIATIGELEGETTLTSPGAVSALLAKPEPGVTLESVRLAADSLVLTGHARSREDAQREARRVTDLGLARLALRDYRVPTDTDRAPGAYLLEGSRGARP